MSIVGAWIDVGSTIADQDALMCAHLNGLEIFWIDNNDGVTLAASASHWVRLDEPLDYQNIDSAEGPPHW